MRRTRSQAQMVIEFPAQKSSRPKGKIQDENTNRRRSRAAIKEEISEVQSLPPTKKSTTKRRMTIDESVTENCSPMKKRNTSGDPVPQSPLALSSFKNKQSNAGFRVPLSPRNGIQQNSAGFRVPMSPRNSVQPSESGFMSPAVLLPSPQKVRALTFSPKNSIATPPQTANSKNISKARALNFSPQSPIKSINNNLPTTPSKFTGLRGCESPQKRNVIMSSSGLLLSPNKGSPVKRVMMGGSPVKKVNGMMRLMSPVKSSSPVKKINGMTRMMSPVKSSPVKRIGLDSPHKESPLRLARQESVCYQKAKQALHTALPDKLLCREQEYQEVNDFLTYHLSKKKAGSMYISGAPGTGKTAVLSKTLNCFQKDGKYPVIYINCMSFKNSAAIYNRVLSELQGKETRLSSKDAVKALEKAFSNTKSMILLILDEIDQLDSKNQEVLYTMFDWPALDDSKLVLIGIANALDLTDRILPRLQSRPKCKPQLMNFAPYTRDQLVAVLKDRLARVEVGGVPVMEPAAIQFCARKVASQAGDMRKALDVCRRAVEMVEADVRKQQVLSKGCSSPRKAAVPKKIGVAHILKIINEVYGSRVHTGQPQTIPLQQKLAICTLLLLRKQASKHKETNMGKLHESFSRVCRQQQVAAVEQGEFHAMCSLIEARGILTLTKAKDARKVKVSLKLDEKELEAALQDKTLLSAVLSKGLTTN